MKPQGSASRKKAASSPVSPAPERPKIVAEAMRSPVPGNDTILPACLQRLTDGAGLRHIAKGPHAQAIKRGAARACRLHRPRAVMQDSGLGPAGPLPPRAQG